MPIGAVTLHNPKPSSWRSCGVASLAVPKELTRMFAGLRVCYSGLVMQGPALAHVAILYSSPTADNL